MGKSKHISKHKRKTLLAERLSQDIALQVALKNSRKRFKQFDKIILDEYNGVGTQDYNDARVHEIRSFFNTVKGKKHHPYKELFKDVLMYLVKVKSGIIKDAHWIRVVKLLCRNKCSWVRDYRDWKPVSNNNYNQTIEFIEHLICKYPVPKFFFSAWFMVDGNQYVNWFVKLAQGLGVKAFGGLPISLTKKMRYYFLQADESFSVVEALRYGQVRGLGGDEILATRIVASRLGYNNFNNDYLWSKFIQIIIQGGMFNLDKLGELIDYVREKLRENQNYSLKGRTLQSLLRQSDEWHHFTIRNRSRSSLAWSPSRINEYSKIVKKNDHEISYYIVEILDAKSLVKEGRRMGHCVGSYATYCARGRTAIFSLRKYSFGIEEERMATIEVNISSKVIVQAKAKFNKQISKTAMNIMHNWATENLLTVSKYL